MPSSSRYPLRQWIWRAFVQSALIPLILVESVLIAVYLLSNQAIRDAQIEHLQETAVKDLASAALREGQIIDGRLRSIESLVRVYRDATHEALLDTRFQADELEPVSYTHLDVYKRQGYCLSRTVQEVGNLADGLAFGQ